MVEVIFSNKTSELQTVLKLDSTNPKQETCTISQITGNDPDFNSITPFKEGSVVTVGQIKKFANENSTAFDATVFDGDNGGVSLTDYYDKKEESAEEDGGAEDDTAED